MKKKIVLSGINLFQAGPLAIYTDLLDEIVIKRLNEQYEFILFVHKRELFSNYSDFFEIIELPKSRKSWIYRIYYEYIYFNNYSRNKHIYLWISLHDMTPNVHAEHLVTYCHNPAFTYKATWEDFKLDKKLFLFSKLYKFLYKINIHKNDFLIVQQDWIAQSFLKNFKLEDKRILVFPPKIPILENKKVNSKKTNVFTFFYPAFPRVFKNFELICLAAKKLEEMGNYKFKIVLTINGDENKYAKKIYNKFSNLTTVEFAGTMSREAIFEQYSKSDCLLFTSKLETWGLPISEAKAFCLPIFVSKISYAYETVGNYEKVKFIDPNNYIELSILMDDMINGQVIYDGNIYSIRNSLLCNSWKETIELVEKEESL